MIKTTNKGAYGVASPFWDYFLPVLSHIQHLTEVARLIQGIFSQQALQRQFGRTHQKASNHVAKFNHGLTKRLFCATWNAKLNLTEPEFHQLAKLDRVLLAGKGFSFLLVSLGHTARGSLDALTPPNMCCLSAIVGKRATSWTQDERASQRACQNGFGHPKWWFSS